MEVMLAPDLQEFAARKVAQGEYSSTSDLLNAALRQMQEQEIETGWTTDERCREVLRGVQQSDCGQFSTRSIEDIIAEGQRLLDAKRGQK